MKLVFMLLVLVGCDHDLVETPDASIDASGDASDLSPCCTLIDDQEASACFARESSTLPSGTCGTFVCSGDGGIRRINFCIP